MVAVTPISELYLPLPGRRAYHLPMITILVPGFNDNTATLRGLATFLEEAGIPAYAIAPQPSDGTVGIESLAAQLAATIEERFLAGTPLNLVGFSMGGLICRAYVQQAAGLARTERLITIATPHQGTWTAYSFNRLACVQMRPGSRFLTELNHDLAALRQINFTSIWTPLDLTILPASSSYLSVGEMLPILSPFHYTMVNDQRILRLVATCLRAPYDATRKRKPADAATAAL